MKIGLGNDHGGLELKETIKKFLIDEGYEVIDYGTNSKDSVDYPEYGKKVGKAVVDKEVELGIVLCGTGIGISMAANKIKGVRCALLNDCFSAKMAKQHNNANVIALGGRVLGFDLGIEIIKTFLNAEFEGGRHLNRINKIEE